MRDAMDITNNYTKRVLCVNTHRVIISGKDGPMPSPHERLRKAREEAGYQSASDAARAMGVGETAYYNHENGWRGLSRGAERYARFFRVSVDWLLFGKGEMRPRPRNGALALPVMGKVGAGAVVDMPDDPAGLESLGEVQISVDGDFLLEVEGESQWPRYLPGERVIVQGQPSPPEKLVGEYAVVQVLDDGRRLLKMLRRGRKAGLWRLESHNAAPEEDVTLMAAWRVKGVWYG